MEIATAVALVLCNAPWVPFFIVNIRPQGRRADTRRCWSANCVSGNPGVRA
jgi:hypothetical protein